MRHFLLSAMIGLGVLFASAPLGRACVNDRELRGQEREFKADYQQGPDSAPPSYAPVEDSSSDSLAALGMAGAFLLGAVVVGRQTLKSL